MIAVPESRRLTFDSIDLVCRYGCQAKAKMFSRLYFIFASWSISGRKSLIPQASPLSAKSWIVGWARTRKVGSMTTFRLGMAEL